MAQSLNTPLALLGFDHPEPAPAPVRRSVNPGALAAAVPSPSTQTIARPSERMAALLLVRYPDDRQAFCDMDRVLCPGGLLPADRVEASLW